MSTPDQKKTPVGEYLAELRRIHGRISQRRLTARAGIDTSYVGKVEAGVIKVPSREMLELLAGSLGATQPELQRLLRLAGHLGPNEPLVPLERASMEVYLRGDPDLTRDQRESLLRVYQELVRGNRGRR